MAKIKLPTFWYAKQTGLSSGIISIFLLPLSWLWRLGAFIKTTTTFTTKQPLPVICVGNVTMGGGGKTPTARLLLQWVREHGRFSTPCFLMRGYGGKHSGPVVVDSTQHTTWDVGDEALMQSIYAPTIVSKNRKRGAALALERGYDLIIMDDGFQNPSLHKDFSLLVVDGGFGFGNERIFPSGPLRETVQSACKRANAMLVINPDENIKIKGTNSSQTYNAHVVLDHFNKQTDHDLPPNKKVVAFAGIARPEKFFKTLESSGYHIHSHLPFPDHHIYTHGQLTSMLNRAEKAGATLITTEKDWVRLSQTWRNKVNVLKIRIESDDDFKQAFFKQLDQF